MPKFLYAQVSHCRKVTSMESNMNELNLYSYWRSSCSWRVRWALEIKGIKYNYKAVNLVKNEQYDVSYTAFNPNARVPMLQVEGLNVSGSLAILEYLDDLYPDTPLLPRSLRDKALVRELVNIIACDTQPIQNLAVIKYYSDNQDERIEFARHWILRGLSAYETLLKPSAKKFSFGSSLTMADVCLIPQIYNAIRFNVDLKSLPRIESIWNHCQSMETFKKSAPENQPDATPQS